MRILLINGSPKGSGSNTYRLAQAFAAGLGETELRECTVSQMDIKPCLGCFSCWNKTPGQCVHRDDMPQVVENMLWADIILWSFPLYYFSIPGPLKTLMDRQLPMVMPFMTDAESGGHPSRYDLSGKRHVVISTCGFYTAKGNYDGVTAVFDHLCGKGNYTTIFCGQGELFRVKELSVRTEEYLSYVKDAGREFACGGISRETREKLDTLLYPRAVFEAMADASWGVEKNGETADETLTFTRQMAALYNPKAWSGRDVVLEMEYTDVSKRYQLLLTKDGHQVLTKDFQPYTTKIETPYSVWKAIASGEIAGEAALMEGKYRVRGDFNLMLHWDAYFGPERTEQEGNTATKKSTSMAALLVPWIVYWSTCGSGLEYAPLLTLAVCAAVPVWFHRYEKTWYDDISVLLVSVFVLSGFAAVSSTTAVTASYVAFGLMWLISCLLPIPLTAHYSMKDYNGEAALRNPLFIKTNRILTACWGVLYLLIAVLAYPLMMAGRSAVIINSVLPVLMGLFTVWFQKWYPAKVARGERKEEKH